MTTPTKRSAKGWDMRDVLFQRFRPAAPEPEPATHHLRFDGVNVGRLDDGDGRCISVCVFRRDAPWQVGDYIIFESTSGQTSRYMLYSIRTPHDPGDQHFLECSFAPRTNLTPAKKT